MGYMSQIHLNFKINCHVSDLIFDYAIVVSKIVF